MIIEDLGILELIKARDELVSWKRRLVQCFNAWSSEKDDSSPGVTVSWKHKDKSRYCGSVWLSDDQWKMAFERLEQDYNLKIEGLESEIDERLDNHYKREIPSWDAVPWISVADLLPEELERVLVLRNSASDLSKICIGYLYGDEWRYCVEIREEQIVKTQTFPFRPGEIVGWLPLPIVPGQVNEGRTV